MRAAVLLVLAYALAALAATILLIHAPQRDCDRRAVLPWLQCP